VCVCVCACVRSFVFVLCWGEVGEALLNAEARPAAGAEPPQRPAVPLEHWGVTWQQQPPCLRRAHTYRRMKPRRSPASETHTHTHTHAHTRTHTNTHAHSPTRAIAPPEQPAHLVRPQVQAQRAVDVGGVDLHLAARQVGVHWPGFRGLGGGGDGGFGDLGVEGVEGFMGWGRRALWEVRRPRGDCRVAGARN
jgi:hypothetical protein